MTPRSSPELGQRGVRGRQPRQSAADQRTLPAGSIANDLTNNGQTTLMFDPDRLVLASKAPDFFLVIGTHRCVDKHHGSVRDNFAFAFPCGTSQ